MSGLLINWLAQGLAADRDPAGPDIHPLGIGFYYETDTEECWFWGDGAWTQLPLGAVPATIADLLAVDGTDGQIIRRVGGVWVADNESVEEAASDGNKYARRNGAWVMFTEGLGDAPADGVRYVRKDNAWVSLAAYLATLGYIGDAPSDGTRYGRLNAAWSAIPAAGISDAPSDGVRYVRKDAAWVSLTAYLTSLGYITDAPSDGTEYVRKNAAWVASSGGGGGALVKIGESILAVAAANISVAAIPGTYRDLIVQIEGRGAGAGTACNIFWQVNGDTAAHYDFQSQNRFAVDDGAAATSAKCGSLTGGASPAGSAGMCELTFASYSRTVFQKSMKFFAAAKLDLTSGGSFWSMGVGHWRSTAAITSVLIFGSENFAAGTIMTVYGRGS